MDEEVRRQRVIRIWSLLALVLHFYAEMARYRPEMLSSDMSGAMWGHLCVNLIRFAVVASCIFSFLLVRECVQSRHILYLAYFCIHGLLTLLFGVVGNTPCAQFCLLRGAFAMVCQLIWFGKISWIMFLFSLPGMCCRILRETLHVGDGAGALLADFSSPSLQSLVFTFLVILGFSRLLAAKAHAGESDRDVESEGCIGTASSSDLPSSPPPATKEMLSSAAYLIRRQTRCYQPLSVIDAGLDSSEASACHSDTGRPNADGEAEPSPHAAPEGIDGNWANASIDELFEAPDGQEWWGRFEVEFELDRSTALGSEVGDSFGFGSDVGDAVLLDELLSELCGGALLDCSPLKCGRSKTVDNASLHPRHEAGRALGEVAGPPPPCGCPWLVAAGDRAGDCFGNDGALKDLDFDRSIRVGKTEVSFDVFF